MRGLLCGAVCWPSCGLQHHSSATQHADGFGLVSSWGLCRALSWNQANAVAGPARGLSALLLHIAFPSLGKTLGGVKPRRDFLGIFVQGCHLHLGLPKAQHPSRGTSPCSGHAGRSRCYSGSSPGWALEGPGSWCFGGGQCPGMHQKLARCL